MKDHNNEEKEHVKTLLHAETVEGGFSLPDESGNRENASFHINAVTTASLS